MAVSLPQLRNEAVMRVHKTINEVICWIKFFISQIITFSSRCFICSPTKTCQWRCNEVWGTGGSCKTENMQQVPWNGTVASCIRGRNSFLDGAFFKWRMHPRRINETSIVFFFVMHHYEVVNLSAEGICALWSQGCSCNYYRSTWRPLIVAGGTYGERSDRVTSDNRVFTAGFFLDQHTVGMLGFWENCNGNFTAIKIIVSCCFEPNKPR